MLTAFTVAQKTGAFTCVASLVWLYFLGIQQAFEQIGRATDWVDGFLRMSLPVALSVPAIFLLVLSWQLMSREATRDRIKNVLGLFFGMGTFFVAFVVVLQVGIWIGRAENPIDLVLALFVSVLAVLPSYTGVARYVMRASGIVPVKGEFVGKGSYMILAFLLWSILSPMGIELSEDYQADTLLDLGFIFGPIIISYTLYRIAVKYWVRDTFDEQVALDHPSKHQSVEDV